MLTDYPIMNARTRHELAKSYNYASQLDYTIRAVRQQQFVM